ncbi:hypothetical protein Ahia01_000408400 [Argonauta hians]
MSTFKGRMLEYPFISLDQFEGENLSSTIFFLSHTHWDHTVGLQDSKFLEALKRPSTQFYCSKIARTIILRNPYLKHLEPYVKILEVNCPTLLEVPINEEFSLHTSSTITVTLLQANHCLGSVMFLIEGFEGSVLYTGDFRWEEDEFFQVPYLRSGDSVKIIKSLYVDSTFCTPEAFHFPTRTQSYEAIVSLVTEHFNKSHLNYVCIHSQTGFGYERLLEKLAKTFRTKVHVDDYKQSVYETIPKLNHVFSTCTDEVRIHFHKRGFCEQLRNSQSRFSREESEMIAIKVSTIWFVQESKTKPFVNPIKQIGANKFRAFFSFHPSYEELRSLIKYLKPQKVFPNVCPDKYSLEQIQKELDKFLEVPTTKKHPRPELQQISNKDKLGTMKLWKVPEISYPPRESLSFSELDNTPGQRSQKSIPNNDLYDDGIETNCSVGVTSGNFSNKESMSVDKSSSLPSPPSSSLPSSSSGSSTEEPKSFNVMSQSSHISRDSYQEEMSQHASIDRGSFEGIPSQPCSLHREMSSVVSSSDSSNSKQGIERTASQSNSDIEHMGFKLKTPLSRESGQTLHSDSMINMAAMELHTTAAKDRGDNENIFSGKSPVQVCEGKTKLIQPLVIPSSSSQYLNTISPKSTDKVKNVINIDLSENNANKDKMVSGIHEKPETNEKCVNYEKIPTKTYTLEQNEDKEVIHFVGNSNESTNINQTEMVSYEKYSQIVNLGEIFEPLNSYFAGNIHVNSWDYVSEKISSRSTNSIQNLEDSDNKTFNGSKSEIIAKKDRLYSNDRPNTSHGFSFGNITEKKKKESKTYPNKNKCDIQNKISEESTEDGKSNEVPYTVIIDKKKTEHAAKILDHDRKLYKNVSGCTSSRNNIDKDNSNDEDDDENNTAEQSTSDMCTTRTNKSRKTDISRHDTDSQSQPSKSPVIQLSRKHNKQATATTITTNKTMDISQHKILTTHITDTQTQPREASPFQLLGKHKQATQSEGDCSKAKKVCDVTLLNNTEFSPHHSVVLEKHSEIETPTIMEAKEATDKSKPNDIIIIQDESLNSVEDFHTNGILNDFNHLSSKQKLKLKALPSLKPPDTEYQSRSDIEIKDKELSQSSVDLSDSQNSELDQNYANKNSSSSQETLPPTKSTDTEYQSRSDNEVKDKELSQSGIVLSDSQNSELNQNNADKNLSESQETLPPSPFSLCSNSQPLLSPHTLERMSLHDNHSNISIRIPAAHDRDPTPNSDDDDVIFVDFKVLRYVID